MQSSSLYFLLVASTYLENISKVHLDLHYVQNFIWRMVNLPIKRVQGLKVIKHVSCTTHVGMESTLLNASYWTNFIFFTCTIFKEVYTFSYQVALYYKTTCICIKTLFTNCTCFKRMYCTNTTNECFNQKKYICFSVI